MVSDLYRYGGTECRGLRQRRSSPRLTSNLGQPVGVLSLERDFLLALARCAGGSSCRIRDRTGLAF